MIGALNKLPVAVSGMIFFADPVTVRSVSAVTLGFAAGLLYTHAKQLSNEAKKKAEAGYAKAPSSAPDSNGTGHGDDLRDSASVPLLDQQQQQQHQGQGQFGKLDSSSYAQRDVEAGLGSGSRTPASSSDGRKD